MYIITMMWRGWCLRLEKVFVYVPCFPLLILCVPIYVFVCFCSHDSFNLNVFCVADQGAAVFDKAAVSVGLYIRIASRRKGQWSRFSILFGSWPRRRHFALFVSHGRWPYVGECWDGCLWDSLPDWLCLFMVIPTVAPAKEESIVSGVYVK